MGLSKSIHSQPSVIVFITPANLDDEMQAQAAELGWPVIRVGASGEALRTVLKARPKAAVVHVADRDQLHEAVTIVQALRSRRPELPLVAISVAENVDIEQQLRRAGVTFYLAGTLRDSAQALAAMLARQMQSANGHPVPEVQVKRLRHERSPPAPSGSSS
jgi:voltage-gated potassium channel Kch